MKYSIEGSRKLFFQSIPFIIFFIIILLWHFTLPRQGDELLFASLYYKYDIFSFLVMRYEVWTSRLLIEGVLVILAALPRIIWIFLDSIICLLIAILIPKIVFDSWKIDENKLFIYSTLSCIIVLMFIFNLGNALSSAGYIATTLNYIWPLAFGLLHFYLVKEYIFPGNFSSTPKKILIYFLTFFSLVFAINQELMLIAVSAAYFFIIFYCWYKKIKIPYSIFFVIFVLFLDFVFVYTCPGNHLRHIYEISKGVYNFEALTFVNKLDLGISVLLTRIVLSYSLINLIFFVIFGIYIYSITKKKTSIVISSIPIIILSAFLFTQSIGYMNFVIFLKEGMTKYGLLHSDITHILVISSMFLLIIISVLYGLLQMYKNGKKELSYAVLSLLVVGIVSQAIRGFSPSGWGSGQRWDIYYYFCVSLVIYLVSVDLLESKSSNFGKWLKKRKSLKYN